MVDRKLKRLTGARGASLVEFSIAAPVLILLGLATVQIGLIYHAKITLNYATFEAARVGAVNHAGFFAMKEELSYRMAPVQGGDGTQQAAARAISRSMLEGLDPRFTILEVVNPTREMFDAWGVFNAKAGVREIPNHHMRHQDPNTVRAGVSIHDANLLKIKTTYGYRPQIPVAGKLLTRILSRLNPEKSDFYQHGRIPLISTATVRMQNEARYAASTFNPSTDGASLGGTATITQGPATQVPDSNSISQASCDEHGLGEVKPLIDPVSAESTEGDAGFCEVGTGALIAGSHLQNLQDQFQPCV